MEQMKLILIELFEVSSLEQEQIETNFQNISVLKDDLSGVNDPQTDPDFELLELHNQFIISRWRTLRFLKYPSDEELGLKQWSSIFPDGDSPQYLRVSERSSFGMKFLWLTNIVSE
jgi:hypothetical protein